jgi:hypothetical protein
MDEFDSRVCLRGWAHSVVGFDDVFFVSLWQALKVNLTLTQRTSHASHGVCIFKSLFTSDYALPIGATTQQTYWVLSYLIIDDVGSNP